MLLCCSAAGAVCWLGSGHDLQGVPVRWLPLLFLPLVTIVAMRCGAVAGIIGTCSSSAILALYLFPPVRSLAVSNLDNRSALAWLVLGGIAISFLFGSSTPRK